MIVTKNITKKYGDFLAIKNLSLNVKEGEILCLLGANGAGKSTIINILLNFTQPSSGTSEKHYNDFKKQVFQFSDKWRNYLVPMLFKNQKFNLKNYNELPNFNYKNRISSDIWLSIIILNLISIIMLKLYLRYTI